MIYLRKKVLEENDEDYLSYYVTNIFDLLYKIVRENEDVLKSHECISYNPLAFKYCSHIKKQCFPFGAVEYNPSV